MPAGRPRKYPRSALYLPKMFFRWSEARGGQVPVVLGEDVKNLIVDGNDELLGHLLDDCHRWSEDESEECPWTIKQSATKTAENIYRQIAKRTSRRKKTLD